MTTTPGAAPAPLYRDPLRDAPADPTVVVDPESGLWHLFYTRRLAAGPGGVEGARGADIGHATSADGRDWARAGMRVGPDRDPGGIWRAPEILRLDGRWHMYLTYMDGSLPGGAGPAEIRHYTSEDLESWEYRSALDLDSERAVDATVHRMPDGRWRMWYSASTSAPRVSAGMAGAAVPRMSPGGDERRESRIHAADSDDLFEWKAAGPAVADQAQAGPSVFELGGVYWMVTDGGAGLPVYRSVDLEAWHRQPRPLLAGAGRREWDGAVGRHAMALPQGLDEAYLYYSANASEGDRRSAVQVARLYIRDGWLRCDRDAPFDYAPNPALAPALRGGKA